MGRGRERHGARLRGVVDPATPEGVRAGTMGPSARVMVWMSGPSGRLYFNPTWTEVTGQTAIQLKQGRWLRCLHPDDQARCREEEERAVAAGVAFEIEYRLRRADGTYAWILDAGCPRPSGVPGYIGAALDITSRKTLEERLRDADRRKDELLAMLAHELRNPLAPLGNALQLIRLGSDANRGAALDIAERQVRHLSRLIDDLLDVSRITHGKIGLRTVRLQVREIVDRALGAARHAVEARRHQLVVSLPEEPVWLTGDPVRLDQMLVNLVLNAVKYTDPGGVISVIVAAEDDVVEVRVRDTGIGIPADMLDRVFDLFTQGTRTLDRAEGGLGIGLTLVRGIAELHGGTVAAYSAGPGHGSDFVVRLPRVRVTAADPLSADAPGARRTPAVLRVLVVDDNRDAASSLAALLGLLGYEVDTADTGNGAIDAVRRAPPDVVLLDIGLPGMDGYEVASRLRADPATAGVRLIALSGYGREEDRRRSEAVGFDAHLVKPVDFAEIERLFARFISPLSAGDRVTLH
jgi:PAS domain S-box-containing protein